MKCLKGLSLAAVAAIGLTAFAGGGIARADLFTDSAKTIRYAAGTTIDLSLVSGSTSRLTSGGSTIGTCTGSTAKGNTSNETGEVVSVNVETLSWSGCSQTTDTIATGKLEIKWISAVSGEIIGREAQWTYQIFGVSCTYGFGPGTKLGAITGGAEPVLKVETTLTKTAGGFLCPGTAGWDAEYVVTEPHALYVGNGLLTSLYTDSAKTTRYATGTAIDLSLKSGDTARLTSGGSTIGTCTGSTAKGNTSNETGEVVSVNVETLSWSGCSQTTDTISTGKLEIRRTSGANGEVIGRESQWTYQIFGVSCTYGFGPGTKLGTLTGGAEPVLKVETTIVKTAGGFLCPGTAGWDAEYVVTEPHALYVGS